MISLGFKLSNPFSSVWKTIYYKDGLFGKWKTWEFQVCRSNSVIGLHFNWSIMTDHAGIEIEISLLGFDIHCNYYDRRHWDDETNKFKEY